MLKITVTAPATDNGAISHLFNNLDLIISNKDKILSREKYSNIHVSGFYVGGLYMGMHEMTLGDLLSLWDKTEWHSEDRYYYNIIGTPLSGLNTAHWYNIKNKTFESGPYFGDKLLFMNLARPALIHLKRHQADRKKSKLSIFDLTGQLRRYNSVHVIQTALKKIK